MITVREAKLTDKASIYAFVCALEETVLDEREFAKCFENNIAREDGYYIVAADEQDQPVGFISCHGQLLLHHNGWVFEIQELFIEETYRYQGIGTLLLYYLERQLTKYDYRSLEVTANIFRTETHAWYKAQGFIQSHKKFTKEKSPKEN